MYTFRKFERLCNKKLTKELFLKGDSYTEEFLRIVYNKSFFKSGFLKIQIIVPKRNVASAVKRNRIKRQIREAVRKNKYFLIQHFREKEICLNCAIIYQVKQQKSSAIIEEKIISLFQRLVKS